MKIYYTLLLFIIPLTTTAHSVPVVSGWNGNIYFSISPPHGPGASEKAWLIVEQAAQYCEKIKYRGRVFLDFNYLERGLPSEPKMETEYFLGYFYKRKNNLNKYDDYWPFHPPTNGLVITVRGKRFSSKKILQLLAFSVENTIDIKHYAKEGQRISQSNIDTVFSLKLKSTAKHIYESEISTKPKSSEPSVFLSLKQDSFYVNVNRWKRPDTLVLKLHDLFSFKPNYDGAFIFDTDSTFQYVGNRGNLELTSKYQVEKMSPYLSGPIINNLHHQVYIIHYNGIFLDEENPPLRKVKKKIYLFRLDEGRIVDISDK